MATTQTKVTTPVKAPVVTTPVKTAVFPGGTYAVDAKGIPYGAPIKSGSSGSANRGAPAPKVSVAPNKVVSSRGGGQTNYSPAPSVNKNTKTPNSTPFAGSYADTVGYKDSINNGSKNNVVNYKQPDFLQKAGDYLNGIFKKVGSSTQGASVLDSITNPPKQSYPLPPQTITGVSKNGSPMTKIVGKPKNMTLASDIQPNQSFDNGSVGYSPTGAPFTKASSNVSTPTINQSYYDTQTTQPTQPSVNNMQGGNFGAPIVAVSPDVASNAQNHLSILDSKLSQNSPFETSQTKTENIVNYAESFKNSVAKEFINAQDARNEYNNNASFRTTIDTAAKKTNTTGEHLINDIMTKIVPVTNGITAPQTTADYLSGGPTALKGIKNQLNAGIAESLNWTNDQKKLLLGDDKITGLLQQQKDESQAMIDLYNRKELNQETSEREKAQLAIDKARAEYQAKDAETELNRQVATKNLTEFLAHIGALNTDGAAGVGLANLEAKYQAMRTTLKSNFDLATREININMNDHLNSLQDAKDEKVFKINQDLHKTEREVALDVMKLDHEYKKDVLAARMKFAEMTRTEQNRANDKADAAAKDWTSAFFTTVAGNNAADLFKSLPKEFQQSWLTNNPVPTGKTRTTLPDLSKDYSSWNKNNPNNGKNYTALNIPNDIQGGLVEDISSGKFNLNQVQAAYPEVSTSYLNQLFNQYKK